MQFTANRIQSSASYYRYGQSTVIHNELSSFQYQEFKLLISKFHFLISENAKKILAPQINPCKVFFRRIAKGRLVIKFF